jgi:hypothetical protein
MKVLVDYPTAEEEAAMVALVLGGKTGGRAFHGSRGPRHGAG